MTRRSFRQVEALIRERTGLSIEHVRPQDRARAIRQAMERAGIPDEERYVERLRGAPARLLDLASEMSVGETYFFRELEQLTWVMDQWLPRHLVQQKSGHVLTVWSAGCSSGEEAYTLAMLLAERGLSDRATIVGTDISEPALARARAGRFSSWSLRATPEPARQRFFTRRGADYQLEHGLMSRVRFERQNLTDEEAPLPGTGGLFDLVLCRNVLIYLTREAQLAVSRRLAHSLAPGGLLIVGASDPFADLPGVWQRAVGPNGVSFTRLGAVEPRSVTPPAAEARTQTAKPGPRDTHVARKRRARREGERPAPAASAPTRAAADAPSGQNGRAGAIEACRAALHERP
ncbi:MAG TPA: protein-glutamate O-methyltransferase CheR, partial [Polyangiales bacterium]